jgi:hypothetical protein
MEKCVFIGYPQGYKGWKFYNPTTRKTVIAERADFDERYLPLSKHPSLPSIAPSSPAVENTPAVTTPLPPSAPVENTPAAAAPLRPRALPVAPKPASTPYYLHDSDSDDESSSDESLDHGGEIGPPALPAVVPVVPAPAPVPASPPPGSPSPVAPPRPPSPIGIGARLPRCTRTKPREWWKLSNAQLDDEVDDDIEDAEMGYEIALSTVSNAEPLSYSEALRRPDAEQWKHAALEELNAHSTNGTWKLVPRPAGKKVIGSKWVFKVKHNADGSIECYKGRVVAKGYNQRPGFDYIEIFAPTVRMPTIRVVLAISAFHDYHLRSIDISHAYLNGEMDCDVYMEQPEGFAEGDPRQTRLHVSTALHQDVAGLQHRTVVVGILNVIIHVIIQLCIRKLPPLSRFRSSASGQSSTNPNRRGRSRGCYR